MSRSVPTEPWDLNLALLRLQPQALAWMVHRENGNGLPPFWEPRVRQAGGALSYVSQLTNFIAPSRPAPLRGGILADDMGLGKTLEASLPACLCSHACFPCLLGACQPQSLQLQRRQQQQQ